MPWIASFHSSRSNVWSLSYFQKFFFSSVRTAKCFSHKSHPSSCTSFTFCFCWFLWTADSCFLTLLFLAEAYMEILLAGTCQLTWILRSHCLCAQTLSNYLFFPLLENTGMQVNCKSSFYLMAALHHNGYKLSSFIHHPCWIATAGFIKNCFSMTDSVEGKEYVMQGKPHTTT